MTSGSNILVLFVGTKRPSAVSEPKWASGQNHYVSDLLTQWGYTCTYSTGLGTRRGFGAAAPCPIATCLGL